MLPPRLLLRKHRQAEASDLPRPLKGTRLNSADCGSTMTDRITIEGPDDGFGAYRVRFTSRTITRQVPTQRMPQ
jgi:hypothetical protein